jgi:GNAT superfamily N-acetyltransferase
VIIRSAEWDDPDATSLRDSQRAEITARYGTADSEPGPAPTAADIVFFLVAYDDDEVTPIGCGGLRAIDERHGEIKRMFVVADRRGSGVAAFVLRSLERVAANMFGWDRLVLETGDQQPDAIRFYEREGYTRIPNFGHYRQSTNSLCFERRLT